MTTSARFTIFVPTMSGQAEVALLGEAFMAITFQKKEAKQRYLILIFASLFLVTFLTVYFSFFKKKESPLASPTVYEQPEIEINFEVINSSFIKELLPFEEIKPFDAQIGRENPFEPY